jgi:hypothetical protein
MKKRNRSNKAGLFFVLLVLAGYFFINLGQKITWGNEEVSAYEKELISQPEECINCGTNIQEQIVPEEPEVAVVMVDEKYTVDITEEVKGLKAFFTCEQFPPNTLDSVTKLCPRTAADWDVASASGQTGVGNWFKNLFSSIFGWGGGNVRVDSDTEIELVSVTYPLAFFLGQYIIQNSNREATLESPNYPSSGQIIDENYTLKTHAPMVSEELKEGLQETVRRDFNVLTDAEVMGGGVGSEYDEDVEYNYEITVTNADHEPECFCDEEEVSNSDYNPGSPNRQGSAGGGFLRSQSPGGDEYITPEQLQCLEVNEDYRMTYFGLGLACLDLYNLVAGKVASIFSIGKWESCTEPQVQCSTNAQGQQVCVTVPPEDCLNTRNIGIRMSPIFGAVDECDDELCANAYLTNSYKAGLSPEQAQSKTTISSDPDESLMFFLGTPCVANLRVGNATQQLNVTCLWDISPYLLDYKLQASIKAPNQEGFPSNFDIYWGLIEQAMQISADAYGLE